MTPLSAFLILILPAIIVAAGLSATAILSRGSTDAEEPRRPPGLLARLLPPAIVLLAFWPADIGQNQWHDLWPRDGSQRYLALAIAAALAATLHAALRLSLPTAALRAALGAAAVLALLTPIPEQYIPHWLLIALTIAGAAWLPLAGAALDSAATRLPAPATHATMVLASALVAPGLYLSTYAEGATLMGALAAIAGGAVIPGLLFRRKRPCLSGAHTVWLALFGAILLVTYGYQSVPAWWAIALMALAPFGVLAGIRAPRPWARTLIAAGVSSAIAGGATLAILASVPKDDPGSAMGLGS